MTKAKNLEAVANDFNIPILALIDFCTGYTGNKKPLSTMNIEETITKRIAKAQEMGLSTQYIHGLMDARKLAS